MSAPWIAISAVALAVVLVGSPLLLRRRSRSRDDWRDGLPDVPRDPTAQADMDAQRVDPSPRHLRVESPKENR